MTRSPRGGTGRKALAGSAKYFVPRLLGTFCAKYPDIDISLEVLNRDGVVQHLLDNQDDLSVMSMPPTDIDLEDQTFMPSPLVVIAANSHALAARRDLEPDDPFQQRFILRERGSGVRQEA